MNERLEDMYFNWLCAKVIRVENPTPSLTFDTLLKTLHNTEFVWLLSGDDNRAADGKELRAEFLIAGGFPDDEEWRKEYPCSVFEMLIAFSRRAEFNSEIPAQSWFWEMLSNLNLNELNDASGVSPYEITEVLEHFMWRQYPPDGDGGLFPLVQPEEDQRNVEIWYQFCAYVVEQDRLTS
jgi:hypothetical protein